MTEQPPIPTTISPIAQAVLAAAQSGDITSSPAPDDERAWQALGQQAASDDPAFTTALAMVTTGAVLSDVAAVIEAREVDGAKYFIATPEGLADGDERVLFNLHGGGFTFGGGATARRSTEMLAGNYCVRTWGLDYRQLPDHRHPAALDDAIAVYGELLKSFRPESIVIGGQSGGASIALAMLLRARDEGMPLPAAAALISPPADLTQSGDTYQTNAFTLRGGSMSVADRYRGTTSLEDPYLSPLFGEFNGFPPTLLSAGTRDFLLSDTVRVHRKMLQAGVQAELHVWEGAPHGMFMGRAPEDMEQVAQIRTFLEAAWERARAGRP